MTQSTRIAQKAQEITDLIESVRGLADLGITLDELIAEGYLSDTEIQIAKAWAL